MAAHSSILAWETPWTEEPYRLYSLWGCRESDTTELHTHFQTVIYLVEIIQEKRQHVIVPLGLYSYAPFLSYGFGAQV